ncbi:hypothetical protein PIB30_106473, partial [Stylosanthes scabra]|nr:hypothetical protein [Stylosanthes scabra]
MLGHEVTTAVNPNIVTSVFYPVSSPPPFRNAITVDGANHHLASGLVGNHHRCSSKLQNLTES